MQTQYFHSVWCSGMYICAHGLMFTCCPDLAGVGLPQHGHRLCNLAQANVCSLHVPNCGCLQSACANYHAQYEKKGSSLFYTVKCTHALRVGDEVDQPVSR
jgi:hypothetical protein